MMADRPIIFSAPMIQALLDGRKSQTRRLIDAPGLFGWHVDRVGPTGWQWTADGGAPRIPFRPRYAVGDRLWVKEAFRGSKGYDAYPPREWSHWPVHYEADGAPYPRDEVGENGKLRSPIHMPLWASRLTLTVTDVRVERLQEISEDDAFEEGVTRLDVPLATYKAAFRDLWNHLHGPHAWDRNDWVAAYTFEVARGNIDQIGGAA